MVNTTHRPLYLRKEAPYTVNRRCGGPQTGHKGFGEEGEKKLFLSRFNKMEILESDQHACMSWTKKISNRNNGSITLPNGLDHTVKNETDTTAVS